MSSNSIKKELEQYIYFGEKINSIKKEICKYSDSATSTTSNSDGMPRANNISDKVGNNVPIILDLKAEYTKLCDKYERKKLLIRTILEDVEEPYSTILREIYVNGKTLIEYHKMRGGNYNYLCEMHGTALKKYEEVKKQMQKSTVFDK